MSFDISFHVCRHTGSPVTFENPFTGETQTSIPSEPLNEAQLTAVRSVLNQAKCEGPDEDGCYVVQFDDGGEAEIFRRELATGCMAAIRRATPCMIQFLFDLLKAGNWVMLPVMQDAVAITTSPESLKGVPDDFPRVVVCNSAVELGEMLAGGVAASEKYRNQVSRNEG